jgi:hypothetical protein
MRILLRRVVANSTAALSRTDSREFKTEFHSRPDGDLYTNYDCSLSSNFPGPLFGPAETVAADGPSRAGLSSFLLGWE